MHALVLDFGVPDYFERPPKSSRRFSCPILVWSGGSREPCRRIGYRFVVERRAVPLCCWMRDSVYDPVLTWLETTVFFRDQLNLGAEVVAGAPELQPMLSIG